MTNERNTTKVIANEIVSANICMQVGNADVTIFDVTRQVFHRGASFRDMRRAADRLGLIWEGTSNSNFRIKLVFSATNSPVYLPNGEVPASIQAAFAAIIGEANEKCYSGVTCDSRFLRASRWVDRNAIWNLRHDIQCIENAMVKYQALVRRAVIGKQGWKVINTMR